jgi:predicted 3-demethylubiquinone-9 3-methyltransferase (glyoxalase superfamily)
MGVAKIVIQRSGRTSLWSDGPGLSYVPFFLVNCETQEEIDAFWEKLSEGGETQQCGWLKDRYGLSWQIVPSGLSAMLQDKDAKKAGSVMKAMMQMTKMDIAGLKRAYAQQ